MIRVVRIVYRNGDPEPDPDDERDRWLEDLN